MIYNISKLLHSMTFNGQPRDQYTLAPQCALNSGRFSYECLRYILLVIS